MTLLLSLNIYKWIVRTSGYEFNDSEYKSICPVYDFNVNSMQFMNSIDLILVS